MKIGSIAISILLIAPFSFTGGSFARADEAEPAAEEAAAEQPAVAGEETVALAALDPPRSLQSIVDERRDTLRLRRERLFDAVTGRQFYRPPWLVAEEAVRDDYRDAMRRLYRRHRDHMKLFHDARRDLFMPWSRGLREQAEAYSFLTQMSQLDRQEYFDNFLFTRPFGIHGPGGYYW